MKQTTATVPRRKYDRAFKQQCVEHWQASGKGAPEVGRELGLDPNRLYVWKKALTAAPGTSAALPLLKASALPAGAAELAAEIDALRRELAHVRQQRDILKKTLGILSEPPPSATHASTP
jgi:transposase-like protein